MPDKGRTLPADPCLWGSEQWHYVPHRCLERCGPWRGSQGCDHHWTWCGCHTFLQSISHFLGFKTCLFYSYFTIHQQHIFKKIRLLTNNIHVHIHFFRLDNTLFILWSRDLIERLTCHLDLVAYTEEAVGPFLELDEGIGGTLYSNAQFTRAGLTGVDIEDIYKTATWR